MILDYTKDDIAQFQNYISVGLGLNWSGSTVAAAVLHHQLYIEAWPLVPDDNIDFVDEDIGFGG